MVAIVGWHQRRQADPAQHLTCSAVVAGGQACSATLDPTSRRMRFPDERELILTDTVGFIRDLPEDLKSASVPPWKSWRRRSAAACRRCQRSSADSALALGGAHPDRARAFPISRGFWSITKSTASIPSASAFPTICRRTARQSPYRRPIRRPCGRCSWRWIRRSDCRRTAPSGSGWPGVPDLGRLNQTPIRKGLPPSSLAPRPRGSDPFAPTLRAPPLTGRCKT